MFADGKKVVDGKIHLNNVNGFSDPDDEKKEFETYILINPRIISNSTEQIYVEEGEGCLSVNRPVEGIVPRYARCTMEAQSL